MKKTQHLSIAAKYVDKQIAELDREYDKITKKVNELQIKGELIKEQIEGLEKQRNALIPKENGAHSFTEGMDITKQ